MNIKTREMILTALFAAMTAIGAFLRIPTPFIPFSLQFLFCAYAGVILGSKLGALSQILYVTIGLAGVPIFTEGGGLSYIFKPSFGYLLGFILCAWIIGLMVEKMERISILKIAAATFTGLLCMYIIALPYLYIMINRVAEVGNRIDFATALKIGFTPFIAFDAIKVIIIAVTAVKVVPILKRNGYITTFTR